MGVDKICKQIIGRSCNYCGTNLLGGGSVVLNNELQQFCSKCRSESKIALPTLDKKVVYLDQFVWSQLLNVENNRKLQKGHEDFYKDIYKRLKNLVANQQILLPISDIHFAETLVSVHARELASFMRSFGGNALFNQTDLIISSMPAPEKDQSSGQFVCNFNVNDILNGNKNTWLPKMNVVTGLAMDALADITRENRDTFHSRMLNLFDQWSSEKKRYADVFEEEMENFQSLNGYAHIHSNLAAVLSQRAINGMNKNKLTRGTLNDFRAIATFAPFVDAMFIDRECANFLEEKDLIKSISFKSKMFSIMCKNNFLNYLDCLERRTSDEIRIFAYFIYSNLI